jgi:hypothetical protein
MRSDNTVVIRSFRLAFEVERRIHKIDRWRIPIPYGLPLRSVGYAIVALAAVLVLCRLPLVGLLLETLPWPVRFGVVPAAVAQLLTQVQVDGRPAHEVAIAWLRLRTGGRRVVALAPVRAPARDVLDAIAVVPDERGPAYRPGSVVGAGPVILRHDAELTARGRRLIVQPTSERPQFEAKRVALKPGQRIVIA